MHAQPWPAASSISHDLVEHISKYFPAKKASQKPIQMS